MLRVARESKGRWMVVKEASEGRTRFLEEEKRRVEEQEKRLQARKVEIDRELEEERVLLGQVAEQLSRLEGLAVDEEETNSWV